MAATSSFCLAYGNPTIPSNHVFRRCHRLQPSCWIVDRSSRSSENGAKLTLFAHCCWLSCNRDTAISLVVPISNLGTSGSRFIHQIRPFRFFTWRGWPARLVIHSTACKPNCGGCPWTYLHYGPWRTMLQLCYGGATCLDFWLRLPMLCRGFEGTVLCVRVAQQN